MPRRPRGRPAILAAAERLFAEQGLAGARTEEIAAAAGVNKALLHYYFGTKEKLYAAVLENLLEQLRGVATAALDGHNTPRAALLGFVDRYFDFLHGHPHYPRLIQREIIGGGPRLRLVAERYLGPLHRRLRTVLRAGIRRRQFRGVDVNHAVITLIGMTVFYFAAAPLLSQILHTDVYAARPAAQRKRAVLDFLRHALLVSPED